MDKLSFVGKSLPRKDALIKVTGRAAYADDREFAGMLYAAAVRSPRPRIKILAISDAKARGIPGYVTLVTYKDIKGVNKWPVVMQDYPFLPEKEARFAGETVALVVAQTAAAAKAAARLVEVKYRELPFIEDPLKALEKDSIKIYGKDNIISSFVIKKGAVDKAFDNAAYVVEGEFSTNYQVHAYLETQGAIAVPETDGGVTVHSSTQCPFYILDAVAAALGLPYHKVKILQTVTGGGFGGKEDVPALVASHAALCAAKTGRPVKLIYGRKEDFQSMSKRHPGWARVAYGADKKGRLTACRVKYVLDGGAYATLSPIVLWRGTVHAAGPYKIANVSIETYAAATNKVPCGAFRGFGQPQICFAQESLIDELAAKIGMDPVEFRLKNMLAPGDKTVTGQKINSSCGLKELVRTVRKRSGWDKKTQNSKLKTQNSAGIARGLGFSATYYGVGLGAKGRYLDRAGALVNIYKDSSVCVNVGNTEMGQGALTVLAQIAAETLNAPYESVRVEEVDTSKVPDSGPTVASRTTLMSGNAIIDAAGPLRERIFKTAFDLLVLKGARASGPMTAARGVFSMGGKSVTFREVTAECWNRRHKMSEQGWYAAPRTTFKMEDGQGDAYVIYSYSADAAEVEVDLKTGVTKVLKIWAAYDVGKIVNPRLATGQAQGGILQGMSWALYENLVYKNGIMVNPNFTDYVLATTADKPEYDITFLEKPYAGGPYKAKGMGEVPLIGVAPAVANAIANACGARVRSVPLLPEKVWKELKK
ncbi:MAG: xanthine dehydrogenase family protein molybdopterin-binding subunit [Elusimicrobia bacterium]|nr:xanthine dehydrogenase family protein molybdopterin-binding subunit [Elusimicrobiota bacterium]